MITISIMLANIMIDQGEYAPGSPLAALFAHYGASGTEFGVDRRIDPMLRASLFCRSAGILFLNPAATSSRLQYSGFANKILDATGMAERVQGSVSARRRAFGRRMVCNMYLGVRTCPSTE